MSTQYIQATMLMYLSQESFHLNVFLILSSTHLRLTPSHYQEQTFYSESESREERRAKESKKKTVQKGTLDFFFIFQL